MILLERPRPVTRRDTLELILSMTLWGIFFALPPYPNERLNDSWHRNKIIPIIFRVVFRRHDVDKWIGFPLAISIIIFENRSTHLKHFVRSTSKFLALIGVLLICLAVCRLINLLNCQLSPKPQTHLSIGLTLLSIPPQFKELIILHTANPLISRNYT